jgi:hypothetical protein
MKWTPIVKRRKHVPWGYKPSEEDPRVLIPIDEHLDLLEQAKEMRSHHSLRELATWLTAVTGSPISHQGLKLRFEREEQNLASKAEAEQEYILSKIVKDNWDKLQRERARLGANKQDTSEPKESFF